MCLGTHNETSDDPHSNITSTTSSTSPHGDTRSLDHGAVVPISGVMNDDSRAISGASEIISLLRILGEGYRLSCMYRCQVLDDYSGIRLFYLRRTGKVTLLIILMELY